MGKISIGSTIIYDDSEGGGGEPVVEGPYILSAYNIDTTTIQIVFSEPLQAFDQEAENLLSFAVIANEYWTQVAYPITAVEFVTANAINIYASDFENIDSMLSVYYNSYYGSLKGLDDTVVKSQVFNFGGVFINLKVRKRETWAASKKTLSLPNHGLTILAPYIEEWIIVQPVNIDDYPAEEYTEVFFDLQPAFALTVASVTDSVTLT